MKLHRSGDVPQSTINVTMSNPFTIVYENFATPTPIWILVLSITVGVLVLTLLIFALYKCGFFERAKKEEMKRITRASIKISLDELLEMNEN